MEVAGSIFIGFLSLVIGIVIGAGALQLTFRFLHVFKAKESVRRKLSKQEI